MGDRVRIGQEPTGGCMGRRNEKRRQSRRFAMLTLRNRWRREAESNRSGRICNPLHNRFAIAPKHKRKGSLGFPFYKLERAKSLELSTSTLARLRSTN
jgi:hypothetical protein